MRSEPKKRVLLTVSAIVEEYGIPKSTIHDLIARGTMPTVRLPRVRKIFIRRDVLDALIASWEVTGV